LFDYYSSCTLGVKSFSGGMDYTTVYYCSNRSHPGYLSMYTYVPGYSERCLHGTSLLGLLGPSEFLKSEFNSAHRTVLVQNYG